MIGMRLLVTATVGFKKRSFHWDESEIVFKDALLIQQRLQRLELLLKIFAYPEDQRDAKQEIDQYKEKLCEVFSLAPSLYEEAECIGKSISDPSLKISALTTLAVNDPSRVTAILTIAMHLELKTLNFLIRCALNSKNPEFPKKEEAFLFHPLLLIRQVLCRKSGAKLGMFWIISSQRDTAFLLKNTKIFLLKNVKIN